MTTDASAAEKVQHGYSVAAVAFDFGSKTETSIDVEHVKPTLQEGRFVWVDVAWSDAQNLRSLLNSLALVGDEVIEAAVSGEPTTRQARYPDYIHLIVCGCRLRDLNFELERVDVIIAQHFLLTIHRGNPSFLQNVKRDYRVDFQRFAQSPSFLIYELWDHLIENYVAVQNNFERRVGILQAELMREVDDRVFAQVSELGADLLHFRKVLLPARNVLTDLSTRKSMFISEATQPFLANMVGTVEHVLQELLVDRDILSESLNLYMSMVGHRTNEVMKRLTVVSVVFLPLTFLVGVYGMNFDVLPELHWPYGYLYFWIAAFTIVAAVIWLARRSKLL